MGLSSSKAAQSSKQPEGAAAGAAVAAAANADSCCGAGGGCSASATAHGTAHGSSEGAACPRMPAAGATGAAADDCVTPLVPRISSSTSGGARRSALRSPEVSGGGLTRKSYSTEGEAARVRFSEDTSEHTTGGEAAPRARARVSGPGGLRLLPRTARPAYGRRSCRRRTASYGGCFSHRPSRAQMPLTIAILRARRPRPTLPASGAAPQPPVSQTRPPTHTRPLLKSAPAPATWPAPTL